MTALLRQRLRGVAVAAVILLSVACAHAPATTDKGFSTARTTAEQLEESFAPRRWALVIGVNNYDDPTFTDLSYAKRDAVEIAQALKSPEHGHFDEVITLTQPGQTTRDHVLKELRRLRTDLRRQDVFVLYFSGHGTIELGPGDVPDLYLVPSDARASDLASTALDLKALRAFMAELKPQRKVMILDNCFAGDGKSRTTLSVQERLTQASPWDQLGDTMGQSEAVLMASTLGGIAREDAELKHGTYTWFLLQALTSEAGRADVDGDGGVTAYEAHDYARGRTFDYTQQGQIPEAWFRFIGRADVYLSGEPSSADAAAAALVYAYGPRVGDGLSLLVDGQSKGVFPRTVAVEPGVHKIAVQDGTGRTVAEGRLAFAEGQSWAVNDLVEEMRGYRRYFSMSTGAVAQPSGPAQVLWGPATPSLSITSGYRVRGGALRGLTLAFDVDWMPTWDPTWDAYTDASLRHNLQASLAVGMRRDQGPWEVGAGLFAGALYVPGLALKQTPGLGYGEDLSALNHRWLTLPVGPWLWAARELNPHLRLYSQLRVGLSSGAFGEDVEPALSAQSGLRMGLELGF